MTTTNLSNFGTREIDMAADLLKAYANNGSACPYFSGEGVQLVMNQNSGNVFLTDENYNVLMMNGNDLEGFYVSPYSGHEGFFGEFVNDWDETWHDDDTKWLKQLAKDLGREDELMDTMKERQQEENN